MIAVLAGGTGAAKFLRGLVRIVPPERVTVIVNTGDDLDWWGLRVCPDIDTITYGLAGLLDETRGWGLEGETFACRDQVTRLGEPAWFNVGDRDLALHLYRSRLLREGKSLTEVTRRVARHLGVRGDVLPMSDAVVRTLVHTPTEVLSFQEFFVRERFQPPVRRVEFQTDGRATPSAEVLARIADCEAIIVAPSNPVTSIGPILALHGMVDALRLSPCPAVAISPIVGGKAVSGPAGKLMKTMGLDASVVGVATAYRDWLDMLVCHHEDEHERMALEAMGITARFTDALMPDAEGAARLARNVMRFLDIDP